MKPGDLAEVVVRYNDPVLAIVFASWIPGIENVLGTLTRGEVVTIIDDYDIMTRIVCRLGLCWTFTHRLQSVRDT